MKKVLFVATNNLFRSHGGAIGQLAYYRSVKELYGDHVDVMMPINNGDFYPGIIGVPPRTKKNALLSGSFHRFKDFVDSFLFKHKEEYGVCVLCNGFYAGDMMDMIHNYGLKIIVIYQDFEPQYQMDNKTKFSLYGITPFFIKRNESSAYLKADVNCFMSQDDVTLFEAHYGRSRAPYVILGCYEKETIKSKISPNTHNRIMCITGSMNLRMSVNGVLEFEKEYFGIFKELCPEWKVVIAGRNPSTEIYKFQKKSDGIVEVIPNPENMEGIIDNSLIFYCPTNSGGGIKTRLMDGLRCGKPVLTHIISARGYQCLWDEPFFQVYNDEQSFRNGLTNLINYVNSEYIPSEILRKYLNYFSFESGTNRMKEAFDLL